MSQVKEFLSKYFGEPFQCDLCGNHISRSLLTTIDSKYVDGKYCTKCVVKVIQLTHWCDGCGEEFPVDFLMEVDDGLLCDRCYLGEGHQA